MVDLRAIRNHSLQITSKLGYRTNPSLPLLDPIDSVRSEEEVVSRLLVLHCVVAVAFGFDPTLARRWLATEGIDGRLTDDERRFLAGATAPERNRRQVEVEGALALAWSLSLVDSIEYDRPAPDSFVEVLPDLRILESAVGVRGRARIRSVNLILAECDLAYLLHWSIRDTQLRSEPASGTVLPYVVEQRRRSLEWILSDCPWEEVPLDT